MMQSEPKHTYVVFDTMIYLHCQQIQDIDLTSLIGVTEVTLVIPRIILQELDKHKSTHQSQKVRDRVAERLKTIKSSVANPGHTLRPGVSIELLTRRPSETAKQHGLDTEWPDDQLIASVLEFRAAHPQDDIILISHDTGPQLTAMQLGITFREMPDTWRIPPEDDPLVSENKRLRNEIIRIQNARPQPVLRLSKMQDDENHVAFRLSRPEAVAIKNKLEILNKLRESYQPRHPSTLKPSSTTDVAQLKVQLTAHWIEQIPKSEYERYNKDLERFFIEYENYLDRLAAYRTQPDRTITLNLEVRNVGGAPAEDVDVYIHFPDGFTLYSEDDLPKEPNAPDLPSEPKTETQKRFAQVISPHHLISSSLSSLFNPPVHTKNTFSLKHTGSYELREHFERIKHGYLMRIRPVFLVFDSFDKALSFGFDYEITAGNVPDRLSERLNVVIEKAC